MCPSPWPMSDPDSLRHVEANGLRFAYFEQGEGPLVLLVVVPVAVVPVAIASLVVAASVVAPAVAVVAGL